MKFTGATVLLFAIAMYAAGQQSPPNHAAKPAPSIGLEVGNKIPAFQLRDQKGQEQSNETLKGANGTILLFFRSADW